MRHETAASVPTYILPARVWGTICRLCLPTFLFFFLSPLSSHYSCLLFRLALTVFFGSHRICHCEGDDESPLITPCHCTGSLRFVHQSCLQQWIKSSDTRCCELCKYEFIMETKLKPLRKVRPSLYSVCHKTVDTNTAKGAETFSHVGNLLQGVGRVFSNA